MNSLSLRRQLGTVLRAALPAVLLGCAEEQKPVAPLDVKVVVAQQNVPLYKEWVGQTLGSSDVEIRARVDGWLQGIHFKEGSEVEEGRAPLYHRSDRTRAKGGRIQSQAGPGTYGQSPSRSGCESLPPAGSGRCGESARSGNRRGRIRGGQRRGGSRQSGSAHR